MRREEEPRAQTVKEPLFFAELEDHAALRHFNEGCSKHQTQHTERLSIKGAVAEMRLSGE